MNVVDERILSKIGQVDYVKDGVLHRGGNAPSIMVNAKSELSQLPDIYPPGTMAYTVGFKNMWQLGTNGAWADIIEEAS